MRSHRSRLAFLLAAGTLAVIVAGTILIVGYFRGPDRGDYVRKNERVANELPLPRRTRVVSIQVLSNEDTVFGEQFSHTVGYTTYITYASTEALSSADVVRFYRRGLSGWHATRWRVGGTWFACFDRNGATVSVQPEGLDTASRTYPKTYGIAIDHKGGRCD